MKPLETAKVKEKRKKRLQTIIGIIIVVIMIASTIGFALLERYQREEEQTQTTYRNYKFIKTATGWQTNLKISNKIITINSYHLPQEVENISSQGKPLLSDFVGKAVFLTYKGNIDKNPEQAAQESALQYYNALNQLALRMQIACSPADENSSFCIENNLPTKSCEDANEDNAIIIIEELQDSTEQATVNYKNYCLEVKGKGLELIKATEKSIFMIFGIIE